MADRHIGTIEFELVSPTKLLISEAVDMVVVPGVEGDIGVLPGHSPLIATVRPGIINIHDSDKIKERIFVGGGFAEISPNRCTVLAEEAIPVNEIDPAQAEARLAKAREDIKASNESAPSELIRQVSIAEGLVTASTEANTEKATG